MDVAGMRKQYLLQGLSRSLLDPDPLKQFAKWFEEAVQLAPDDFHEPNAMTLATADPSGRVSARIVLLKGFDAAGFRFFTNYRSFKAQQLAANPQAALLLYWPYLERQIRIEGPVERLSADESSRYFHARPRGSQLAAAASPQSEVMASRAELERRLQQLQDRVGDAEIPCPTYWGGYLLRPHWFEFWKGRENRLHDRFVYQRVYDHWQCDRLGP